jgi:diguanylate cyclase
MVLPVLCCRNRPTGAALLLERRQVRFKQRLSCMAAMPYLHGEPRSTREPEGHAMEQVAGFEAESPADGPLNRLGLGHPGLVHFDSIRDLFVATGLAPEPGTYELFWTHVIEAEPALSRALAQLLEEGTLTPEAVTELRRIHLGDIAAAEVHELVEAAQQSATALAARLERGHADLKAYDAAISAQDEALSASRTAQEIADLVQRLRRANAAMMAANRRLESDIAAATLETSRLLDRLETAERAARTDPLTGLANRRGLMDALRKGVARALEDGFPLTVGLADIDHFKRINDQWGHSIGDEVLRCVGSHLQAHARRIAGERGFVGRYGGEEFLVALPGIGLSDAAAAMDNARAVLARQVLRKADDGQCMGHVSFSAGVALLRAEDGVETLIDRADAALYSAKRAGRDRVLPERPRR